jgi:hypothetical protein
MAFFYSDVLAGPIVRRVEPKLVSVWVALRKPGKVKLKIWEGLQSGTNIAAPVGEVEVDTLAIGDRLHLALPILESFEPLGHLKNDTIYSYDFEIREPSETAGKGMAALELLQRRASDGTVLHEPLGYETGMLPGFHLPPTNISHLKLLQTSCRIPQSNIDDAMPLMDDVFTAEEKNTGRKAYQYPDLRPHQLFLTGDQIYADEVEPNFLALLNQTGRELLSGNPTIVHEHLPFEFEHDGQVDVYNVPLTCGLFPPSRRQRLTRKDAALSGGFSGTHLLGFSEYVAMYLMAWSTSCWPTQFIQNQLSHRWQRVQQYVTEWKARMATFNAAKGNLSDEQQKVIKQKIDFHGAWRLLPDEWRIIDHYLQLEDKAAEWGAEATAGIPVNLHPDTVTGIPNPESDPNALPHASGLPAPVKRALAKHLTPSWYAGNHELGFGSRDEKDLFDDQTLSRLRGLQKYFKGLPKVRRLLANVATYMMFDDHEITDDWNLFQVWVQGVQDKLLGQTILRNGLLAYGLFQAWGNDPLYFAGRQPGQPEVTDTPGTKMLEDASRLFMDDSGDSKNGPDMSAVVRLNELFNLRNNQETPKEQRVRWHYRVGGHGYEVLSLDIRTFRHFKGPRVPPQLMSLAAIQEQIPADSVYSYGTPPANQGITFVISGMPVLGFPPVVNFVQPMANLVDDIKPKPEPPFFLAKNDYHVGIYDREPEPWVFQEDAWEALLARLANHRRVVFFSGENHYSYTMQLDYWRYRPDGQPSDATRFLQFTSSASKNYPGKGTAFIFRSGFGGRLADLLGQPQERMGWDTTEAGQPLVAPADKPFNRMVKVRVQSNPAIVPLTALPPGTTRRYNPKWSWRADLVRDPRPDGARFEGVTFPQFVEPTSPGEFSPSSIGALAERHMWQSVRAPSRVIVFPSSFGLITVDMASAGPVITYAVNFILRETFDTKARAYTRYTVPLSAASSQPPTMPPLTVAVPEESQPVTVTQGVVTA